MLLVSNWTTVLQFDMKRNMTCQENKNWYRLNSTVNTSYVFKGCICWPITSRQGCPNLKTPPNAADKYNHHFPNLKAAPDRFIVAQYIPKCIEACLFLWKTGWSDNGCLI